MASNNQMWAVVYGPDSSHLINVKWFARKKDAVSFFDSGINNGKIERHRFTGKIGAYGDVVVLGEKYA